MNPNLASLPAQMPGNQSALENDSGADKSQPGQDAKSAAAPPPKTPRNEEPDLVLEPDLPSDGRDEVGEAMIRELPQRPELAEPLSRSDPASINPER